MFQPITSNKQHDVNDITKTKTCAALHKMKTYVWWCVEQNAKGRAKKDRARDTKFNEDRYGRDETRNFHKTPNLNYFTVRRKKKITCKCLYCNIMLRNMFFGHIWNEDCEILDHLQRPKFLSRLSLLIFSYRYCQTIIKVRHCGIVETCIRNNIDCNSPSHLNIHSQLITHLLQRCLFRKV